MFQKRVKWFGVAVAALSMLLSRAVFAQNAPAVLLQVEVDNVVLYVNDVSDQSTFATVTTATTAGTRTFGTSLLIGDIVAVNGIPSKGTAMIDQHTINL